MNVVCIGGGKGLASALQAWCQVDVDLTAIVATTDNGGSSGRLRQAGSPVPWGDLRKALVALSSNKNMLSHTLSHRYAELGTLSGHCIGNLLLEAYFQQLGSVCKSVDQLGKQLGAAGKVLPMSEESVNLLAMTRAGEEVWGECEIDSLSSMPQLISLDKQVAAPDVCIKAIREADLICIGPGSLLTSVAPVLLVDDIRLAISAQACPKLLIHNIAKEISPACSLNDQSTFSWFNNHFPLLGINIQLHRDAISLNQHTYKLPQTLKLDKVDGNNTHQIDALSEAFQYVSELLCRDTNILRKLNVKSNCVSLQSSVQSVFE
jgi:uncharacterized cofD-like protein